MTSTAARLQQLARTLNAIPHIDRHADCGCPRCRAQTWATTGYPQGTLGDGTGSRSSDSTSSTERHALTLTPAPTHLARWDAAITALDTAAITLHNLLVELGYDPTNPQKPVTLDDRVAVGRGNCARCDRFCIGDGETNRLRSGFCHRCYQRWLRWRATNGGNTTDFIRQVPV